MTPLHRILVAASLAATLLAVPAASAVEIEQRLAVAEACVAALTDEGEWAHDRPPAAHWLERDRWCREPRGDDPALPCEQGATDLVVLRLEHDREAPDELERLALQLALDPGTAGWDVQLYGTTRRLEPGSTLGEDSYSLASITVTRAGETGEAERLSLTRFSFQVYDRVLMGPGEYLPPEELHARFESPEALRDTTLDQLDHLEAIVTRSLDDRQLSRCPDPDDPARFQCGPMAGGEGHAMFDTCVRRGLTDDEIAETRARLHGEIEAQRVLISQEYFAIHHAVSAALAVEACWLLVE